MHTRKSTNVKIFSKTIPVLIAAAAGLTTTACTTPDNLESQRHQERLTPTGVPVTFDPARYRDFNDFIRQSKAHLSAHKVFFNPANSTAELQAALPFRLTPSDVETITPCDEGTAPTRGIVLFHGLSDMPAAMEDLAHEFTRRCFTSYSMLLPAHGSRPSELLEVTYKDWLFAAKFSVDELKKEVDEVYVGGFSLGGLIALKTALDNAEIKAVFAFSPAFALHRSLYLDQTLWLRHLKDWIDTDLPDDPWRFESMPLNALAETQRLSKSVRKQLQLEPLDTPIFIAQSPDDAIVNASINRQLFDKYMSHANSRLVSYESGTAPSVQQGRVIYSPNSFPEQNIISYAHQAVHVSPANEHYGVNGVYRNCQINVVNRSAEDLDLCRTSEKPYRGEVFGDALTRVDANAVAPMARLTFNPLFSELLQHIDSFLSSNAD